jgi:hypothetical protein
MTVYVPLDVRVWENVCVSVWLGMCVHAREVNEEGGGPHTVLSAGQHDGHLAPGVYTGCFPASQNPSSPKHSHVWSFVSLIPFPGQHESLHLQSSDLQSGQSVWHRDSVGSTAGGSQNPSAVGKVWTQGRYVSAAPRVQHTAAGRVAYACITVLAKANSPAKHLRGGQRVQLS